MFTFFLKGHFETENLTEFIDKLQEILKETDTIYLGQILSYTDPRYIDNSKIEFDNAEESENTTERINN